MEITDEYIDKCLKVFYRFLKEEKKYRFVRAYLFYPGRSKREFYDAVKMLYSDGCYNFGDILHITYTVGPNYENRNGISYDSDIYPLSVKFEKYWRLHKI
jgi:hypothetical protein